MRNLAKDGHKLYKLSILFWPMFITFDPNIPPIFLKTHERGVCPHLMSNLGFMINEVIQNLIFLTFSIFKVSLERILGYFGMKVLGLERRCYKINILTTLN